MYTVGHWVNVGKVGIKKRTLNRRWEGLSQFLNVVRTGVNGMKYNSQNYNVVTFSYDWGNLTSADIGCANVGKCYAVKHVVFQRWLNVVIIRAT